MDVEAVGEFDRLGGVRGERRRRRGRSCCCCCCCFNAAAPRARRGESTIRQRPAGERHAQPRPEKAPEDEQEAPPEGRAAPVRERGRERERPSTTDARDEQGEGRIVPGPATFRLPVVADVPVGRLGGGEELEEEPERVSVFF